MSGTLSKDEILRLIRRKIQSGVLPNVPAKEIWGGRGTGAQCAACDRTINPSEPEIEADCMDNVSRFYHAECHLLMEKERGRTAR
jgi:hypothetical protein